MRFRFGGPPDPGPLSLATLLAAALLAREHRTDPEDKQVYSLSELQEKYQEKYSPDTIEQYFKTECRLSAERPIKEPSDAKSSEASCQDCL